MDKEVSKLISISRFPLLLMVLYVHSLSGVEMTTRSVYSFVSELISHNLGRIAVPCFYVISGYLFMQGISKTSMGSWYPAKLTNRVRKLVLPYLLWNVIFVVCYFAKVKLFSLIGIGTNTEWLGVKECGIYGVLWGCPVDFPLWYLRDLICMSLFAPLFYLLFYRSRFLSIIMLMALYLSTWEVDFPGISMTAVFFFGTGSWLSIQQIDVVLYLKKLRAPIIIIAAVMLLLSTWNSGMDTHELLCRSFVSFGVFSFFSLMSLFLDNQPICDRLINWSKPAFFVYAVHELFILGWIKGAFFRIIGESPLGTWLRYLFVPILTLLACLALYGLLRRMSPKTLSVLCGGR